MQLHPKTIPNERPVPHLNLSLLMLVLVSCLHAATRAHAGDWPQFRGPGGSGSSQEKGLPVAWSKNKNIRWKAPLPGHGNSNPVIAGGKVFVTASSGFDESRLHVLCLDQATGKQLWQRQFKSTGNTLCHPKSNMATPTPVTDGKAVYALFATSDLVALNAAGDLLWYRSLTHDYGRTGNVNGLSASPVLWKNVLILPMDNLAHSYLAGVDVTTGKNLWKRARPRDHNWSSPLLVPQGDKAQVVISAVSGLLAYDAESGRELWALTSAYSNLSTPVLGGGLLLAAGGPLTAFRPQTGQSPQGVWQTNRLSPNVSSPSYHDNRVYAINPPNILVCADALDGKVRWQQRLPEGTYWASPVAADGKVYAVNDAGTTTVVQCGDRPNILARNMLDGPMLATPAIAGGCLFLRSDRYVYCVAEQQKSGR
jgi:outer membrane protein assembly factor BamB